MSETVIVATVFTHVVKVCESWDAYDEWLASSEWDSEQVSTVEAHVYRNS